ncbi:MAG: glycosyltransferase family 2 protein, partial [Haloechinothrix sp.]
MTAVERLPTRSAAPAGGQPEVSVVVVTYRSASYVGRCLSALNVALRGVPAEVVVVDNASGDGIREAVAAVAPHALVVVRKQNGGFAAGCHAGAAVARGRRLVFVNPDAMVEPGCVAALLDCADRNPDAGIVGGRCVDEDGRTDPRSWFGRPTLWSVLCFATGLSTAFPGHRLFDPESPRLLSGERKVPVVSGALMLVERATWDDLGGFDPTYFLYGEDADLCLRAAARGWRPVVTPEAVFIHPGGASSSSELKQVFLFTGKATLVRR